MNLDAGRLDRVVAKTEARTKTEAVTTALRGVERRCRLIERLREGLGASEAKLTGFGGGHGSTGDNPVQAQQKSRPGGRLGRWCAVQDLNL